MRCCKDGQPSNFNVSLSWSKEQPDAAGPVSCREEIGDKIARLTDILLDEGSEPGKMKASFGARDCKPSTLNPNP